MATAMDYSVLTENQFAPIGELQSDAENGAEFQVVRNKRKCTHLSPCDKQSFAESSVDDKLIAIFGELQILKDNQGTMQRGWTKQAKVLIIGLDNSGKSSLLTRVSSGRLIRHDPTIQSSCKELSLEGLQILAYDLPGHRYARRLWRDYLPTVDGVVFMVDSADNIRFEEARDELDRLLHDDIIADVPVVVLANKIDRRDAVSEETLATSLGLTIYRTGKECVKKDNLPGRPVELFPCSVLKQKGYGEALRWLVHYMKQGLNT